MSNPRIFISYAHADSDAARRIADELREMELQVWLDASSLQPGQNWVAEIERGLEEAGYLLVLLSSASVASQWVQREWTSMLTRQLGGKNGGIVIPLRLEDVGPPTLLRPLQYVDLFPDFDAGVAKIVGFLLSQTRPAWLVQEAMKTRRTFAEVATAPTLRAPGEVIQQRGHGYSSATWQAWHAVMGHEPLTDAALQQMDTRTIRRLALHCITLQHLQSFCIDTRTDRGSLSGNSLNEQILSLLELLLRESRLDEFIRWLAEEAPRCVQAAVAQFLPEVLGPSSRGA
jgi:TIR domain